LNKKCTEIIAACFLVLVVAVPPSLARLTEGNTLPFSTVSNISTGKAYTPYCIQQGDTLWDIASRYRINVNNLMMSNGLDEKSVLQVDSVLKIPCQKAVLHVITSGDTMWGIASQYHISVEEIMDANQNRNPNSLNIGENLIIPASDRVLAITSSPEPSRGLFSAGLMWPLTGTITSGFGWRKSGFHHGLDIANNLGTPIYAAAAGTVSFVGYKPIYGNMVIIDHPDGKKTVYAHIQKTYVKHAQKVSRGQKIATVGVSGRTTGPHLHFEVRYGDKAFDPLKYLQR